MAQHVAGPRRKPAGRRPKVGRMLATAQVCLLLRILGMERWWCRWRRIARGHVTAKYRRRSGVGAAKLFSEALQIAAPKAARSTAPPTRALAQVGRRARCGEAACDKGPRPTILVLVGSNRGGVFCFVPLWYGDSFRAQLVSQSLFPGRFFFPPPWWRPGGSLQFRDGAPLAIQVQGSALPVVLCCRERCARTASTAVCGVEAEQGDVQYCCGRHHHAHDDSSMQSK